MRRVPSPPSEYPKRSRRCAPEIEAPEFSLPAVIRLLACSVAVGSAPAATVTPASQTGFDESAAANARTQYWCVTPDVVPLSENDVALAATVPITTPSRLMR